MVASSLTMTVSERLANWATTQHVSDFPSDVSLFAKRLIIDSLGLQVRGSTLRHVQPQRRLVESAGSRAESTITATGFRSTMASAAYVNGTFAASMEFDECNMLPWHSASIVVPTSLAVVEAHHRPGSDLLLGTVVGQQVQSLLGTAVSVPLMERGWHLPRAMGPFAATAAAGSILRADEVVLAHAFGVAAGDASGPMEYDRAGGEVKRQYTGSAARAGIEALQLAIDGVTGPSTIFEGTSGLFRLMAGTSEASIPDDAWNTWYITDTFFRLNPGVGTVLPALEVVADVATTERINWREIEKIDVGLPAFAVSHGGNIIEPTDSLAAHFSLAFALALRLVTGASAPADYLDSEVWSNPDILVVASKVRPFAMEFAADAPLLCADVRITMADGRILGRLQHGFHGHTTDPVSDADIEAKFHANTEGILPESNKSRIIEMVHNIEYMDDIEPLVALLNPL